MPNWCYNSATLYNEDKTKIDALEQELMKEDSQVFNHLNPRPAEHEEDWYGWNCDNWGTKWDTTPHDWDRNDDNTISINFDTAWSPPIALYEYLNEDGWDVRALYHEPGMAFAGRFEDGYDDYFELDMTDRESIENLPEDILDFTNALEDLERYEEEQLEEQLAELDRTEWYPVKVSPVADGRYEVTTKDYEHPQYANYADGKWSRWVGDEIKVVQWRGLVQPYEDDEWDPVAELDKIVSPE
jgi:hypothetical protein